jgi:hypothetical protein
MLTLLAPAASGMPAARMASAAGVEFRWAIQGQRLHGCMQARTRGWIAVGFNLRDDLAGARLVMGRVVAQRAHAEVHLARPPLHLHRHNADGSERVEQVSGQQHEGRTQVCFVMPLAAADADDVDLAAGSSVHLVLAWSHEPDFDHHSAQRGSLSITL